MNPCVILFNPIAFPRNIKGRAAEAQREMMAPLSLLAIAAPLLAKGYSIKIIDQQADPDWQRMLKSYLQEKPLCVGITSMTGYQIISALEASKIIKEHSNTPVIWGGVHPTLLPRQTIENNYIDIVVEGEGEDTFSELVEALRVKSALSCINGIWYKENGLIIKTPPRELTDLNSQQLPPYNIIQKNKYKTRTVYIFTSKGCPNRCAYCYHPCHVGTWRALNAKETLKRIEFIMTVFKENLNHLYIVDNNFFVDRERAKDVIEGLAKFSIPWSAHTRIDTFLKFDEAFLRLMEKSKCISLRIGIESGSQRMLELMKTDIVIPDVITINKRLSRFDFRISYNFMIGIPTETISDIKDTFNLISLILKENKKAKKNLNVYTPYPGNELFNLAIKYGYQHPQDLIGWSDFNIKNTRNRPWLDSKRKQLIEMLLFCSPFLEDKRLFDSSPIHFLSALYRPIAKQRIKNLYYGIPLDIKIGRKMGFLG